MKLPRTLFGGRIRSSTVGLMVSFLAVLTVWVLVRPEPITVTEEVSYENGVVTVRKTTKTTDKDTTTVVEPTPTPTPKATSTPKATPTATPAKQATKSPSATPTPTGVGGLLAPQSTPSPTPTPVPFEG